MSVRPAPTSRLLMISPDASQMTDDIRRRLERSLPGYRAIDFDPRRDFRRQLTPAATVVVAGGDGTIGFVARALAGSRRKLAIVPLGTYNNFARALGIPENVSRALRIVGAGTTRSVTLGDVNGRPFLEAAAVGLFGDAIVLGERAKELEFGSLAREVHAVAGANSFEYVITGDLEGHGKAFSLVFTNTPTTGARMAVGTKQPAQPFLELSVQAGSSRADVVSRLLTAAVRRKHIDEEAMTFRFRSVHVVTSPRVHAVADNSRVGRTPVTIRAMPRSLHVIVP